MRAQAAVRATPAQTREAIAAFAARLAWSLHVPGQHTRGPSYDDLLGYLAAQGRDFRRDTAGLRRHVRQALLDAFGGATTLPTRGAMTTVVADAILEWIVMRFDNLVQDVRIPRNKPAYGYWKAKHGLDSRPGQATGELRDALADAGEVTVAG